MKKRIKKRFKKMVRSKYMLSSVGIASFLESTVVPIPLETLLIPLMQARRDKIWLIALITLLGCVAGALCGYFIGMFLFEALREPIMNYITSESQFEALTQQIHDHGFWFVFSTGVTPIPLQVAMIVAGVSQYSVTLYMIAVVTSRTIRYLGLALLVYFFGNKTEKIIRRYKWQTMGVVCIALIAIVSYKIFVAP
ncbi:YqaA family protein [Ningiella sp. W23]|uniref:YqaA family protein n=1 Tax=Ningiella sp. W23 TaxID=3023715 RepID=UPI00375686CB